MKDTNILINNGVNLDESLKMLGDIETYNETLPNFVSGLNKKISNLRMFLSKNDMANYAIDAHSIKSDAKFFGFMKLSEIALDHELHGKENNIEYIKSHFDLFENEVNNALNIIDQYINDNTTSEIINISDDNRKKILIADDSEVVIVLAKKILGEDYNITSCVDGAEVINVLEQNTNFDAILLDINMPKIDGYGVLEYMSEKDLFDKIPVSIISGNNDKESIEKAFTFPIVDMLNKPFNDVTIKGILKKTLDRKK